MQEELASGRGTFFSAVLQNMSRRISPALPASSDSVEPLQSGASLSRYWERFGDFAGQRDLGAIAHGLATGHGQPSGGADPAGFRSCSLPGRLCGANVNGQRPLRAWFPIEDPPSSMFTARSSRNWIPSKLQTKRGELKKSSSATGAGEEGEEPVSRPAGRRAKRQDSSGGTTRSKPSCCFSFSWNLWRLL